MIASSQWRNLSLTMALIAEGPELCIKGWRKTPSSPGTPLETMMKISMIMKIISVFGLSMTIKIKNVLREAIKVEKKKKV